MKRQAAFTLLLALLFIAACAFAHNNGASAEAQNDASISDETTRYVGFFTETLFSSEVYRDDAGQTWHISAGRLGAHGMDYVNETAVWVRLPDGMTRADFPGNALYFEVDALTRQTLSPLPGDTQTISAGAVRPLSFVYAKLQSVAPEGASITLIAPDSPDRADDGTLTLAITDDTHIQGNNPAGPGDDTAMAAAVYDAETMTLYMVFWYVG